jgi:hypothetical protein
MEEPPAQRDKVIWSAAQRDDSLTGRRAVEIPDLDVIHPYPLLEDLE